MWCNEASYFEGKFSSGATPRVSPKKDRKILKPLEIPHKKKVCSDKVQKTKPMAKKSAFSKLKKPETSEPFSPLKVHKEYFEMHTPSPKKKKSNFFNTGSASIKKMKNSASFDGVCDLDTTDTTDFLEEDFLLQRNNNKMIIKSKDPEPSSVVSRFTEDYEILKIIGKGCFGNVYKCRNKIDGLVYAIKCSKNQINCNEFWFFSQNNLF